MSKKRTQKLVTELTRRVEIALTSNNAPEARYNMGETEYSGLLAALSQHQTRNQLSRTHLFYHTIHKQANWLEYRQVFVSKIADYKLCGIPLNLAGSLELRNGDEIALKFFHKFKWRITTRLVPVCSIPWFERSKRSIVEKIDKQSEPYSRLKLWGQ